MKRAFLWVCFLVLVMFISTAVARAPLGGLAVSVSPDGKTIAAGGDNRVLYVIDGDSMKVKQRIWMEATMVGMHFNKDGSRLLVEDTSSTIHFLDTKKWVVERQIKKAAALNAARNADLFAVQDSGAKTITVYSMSDGTIKGKVSMDEKVAAFGLNAAGTRLAVFSKYKKDETEPKVEHKAIPKNLKGLDKKEFKEKNDGRTSMFYIFEVPSAKEVVSKKSFYTTRSRSQVLFDGDAVVVVNYDNVNARVTGDGKVKIFETLNSFNYGHGASADQKLVGTGGLARGTYTKVGGLASVEFKVDKLPGWPEYFKYFDFDSKGNAYATTSGYRLIKIKPGGKVATAVAVY